MVQRWKRHITTRTTDACQWWLLIDLFWTFSQVYNLSRKGHGDCHLLMSRNWVHHQLRHLKLSVFNYCCLSLCEISTFCVIWHVYLVDDTDTHIVCFLSNSTLLDGNRTWSVKKLSQSTQQGPKVTLKSLGRTTCIWWIGMIIVLLDLEEISDLQ